MKQKLILVSLDAMIYEDLAFFQEKAEFRDFLSRCARVNGVKSIYPTLTYPCHATMASGCWPSKHGVLNNLHLCPGDPTPPWHWYHDVYRVPDLVDAAREAGLTTAVVGWPTMGCHPSADYLVAEIAGTKAKTSGELRELYLKTGTTEALWEEVGEPNIALRSYFNRHSTAFNTAVCRDIIIRHAPDLVLLHVGEPDHSRHGHGAFSPELAPALELCHWILHQLLEAIRLSGYEDSTNLVITADHGQMDVNQYCMPNVLFAENGLIDVDDTGAVTAWRAWSLSAGMSAQIHVPCKEDIPRVRQLLEENLGRGYSRIYTREEAALEGCDGPYAFVLESDVATKFLDKWTGPYLEATPRTLGSHGFHPDKGPRPPILAAGPRFRPGAVLEEAALVDGAPTWAAALGIPLPHAEGRALTELFR